MELHIGREIEKKFEESGLKPAEFAKRINTGSRNIYTIFKRKHINTELLHKIGEVLKFDFFSLFRSELKPEMVATLNEPLTSYPRRPTDQIFEIFSELKAIEKFVSEDSKHSAADVIKIALLQDISEKLGKQVSPYLLSKSY